MSDFSNLSPTELKSSIDADLAKLRNIHDDPNSGISDADRGALNNFLYKQNKLGIPQTPITPQNIFPLTNETLKAGSDVAQGRGAQWDPQHPFASIGGQARNMAGMVSPFLAPVTGVVDLAGDAIKSVVGPTYESLTGQDPQLNFGEKVHRALTTNRDIGDVGMRKTVQDAPFKYKQYIAQGMTPQQAQDKITGDVVGNFMGGGTLENLANIALPEAMMRGPGVIADASKGIPKAPVPAGTPPVIPGMNDVPAPDFGPNIIQQSAVQDVTPVEAAQPPPVVQPPAPKGPSPTDMFMPQGGQGQMAMRGLLPPKNPIPPAAPELSDVPFGPIRDQGQQQFDFTQGPQQVPVKPPEPVVPPAQPKASWPSPDDLRALYEKHAPAPNVLEQAAQPSLKDLRARLLNPNISDEEFNQIQSQIHEANVPVISKEAQVVPLEPAQGPVKLNPRQMFAQKAWNKLNDEALGLARKSDISPADEARLKVIPQEKAKLAKGLPPQVMKQMEKDALSRVKSSEARPVSDITLSSKKTNINPDEMGLDEEGNAQPTPLEDLHTILDEFTKGTNPEDISTMNSGPAPKELSPEAKAAIQRWKDVHGPAVLKGIAASGKDAFSALKEKFPDLPEEHLKAMADAIKQGSVPLSAKNEVPVTTKDGRGQYKDKVNLSVYSDKEVAGKIMDVIDANPEIAKGRKFTDEEVNKGAAAINAGNNVKDIWNKIQELPEGQIRTEIRAQGQELASKLSAFLKTDFGEDVSGLKDKFDAMAAKDIAARRKMGSEMGGALREFGLPIDAQKGLTKDFQNLLEKYKDNPDIVKKINQFKSTVLSKEFNPSIADKLYYIWVNGLVGGPHTAYVKMMSDMSNLISKFPDRISEAILDMGASVFTGKRSTTMDEIPKMFKALFSKNELPEQFQFNGGKQLLSEDKYEPVSPLQDKFTKKLEPAMYGTKVLRKITDMVGNKVAQMEYSAIKDKALDPITMRSMIHDEASLRTLTRAPASLTKVLLFAKQNAPGARWVLPFIRTAADIMGQAAEHTPAGVYGIVKSAKAGTLTQREFVQRAARMTRGTMALMYVHDEWKKGDIVGDAPKDPKARKLFLELHPENSLRLGGKWVPLSNVEPLGSVLSEFANFFEGMDQGKKDIGASVNNIMSGVMQAGVSLTNKRYLSGVQNVINAASDPVNKGPGLLGQIASGFVPAPVKTVADTMDTTVRKASTIPERFEKRIPGLSRNVPPVIDTFGREQQKPSGLNIFGVTDATPDKEHRIIGDNPMSTPEKRVYGNRIDPIDQVKVQKMAGALKARLVDSMGDRLANLRPDIKQKMLDEISNAANNLAEKQLVASNPQKYGPKSPFTKK